MIANQLFGVKLFGCSPALTDTRLPCKEIKGAKNGYESRSMTLPRFKYFPTTSRRGLDGTVARRSGYRDRADPGCGIVHRTLFLAANRGERRQRFPPAPQSKVVEK
jgi:hypothetical protein